MKTLKKLREGKVLDFIKAQLAVKRPRLDALVDKSNFTSNAEMEELKKLQDEVPSLERLHKQLSGNHHGS